LEEETMPSARINGVELEYERHGAGERVVLVHGSWGDRGSWQLLVPLLAGQWEVVAYDRRAVAGTRADDVEDLAGLIARLGPERVHLVGSSFGGSIALHTAVAYPDLLASVSAHEPPLFGLPGIGADDHDDLEAMSEAVAAVLRLIEDGAHEEAARLFMESVAFGPGAWEALPDALRHTFVRNAPTFLDEQRDPNWSSLDVDALAASPVPIQLTHGGTSRPAFRAVIEALGDRLGAAAVVELPAAGHVPHATHPDQLADLLGAFFVRHSIVPSVTPHN
jgi:pimeloyl-ACP methyl ester carboxylesterase